MNEHPLDDFLTEPERYELDGDPFLDLTRRDLLRLVGGGVIVAFLATTGEADAQQRRGGRGFGGAARPRELGAWLHVAEDSTVTVYTGKVEVGQNIRTSLTQVVAEELHLAPGRITLVMADTARTPYDFGTAGSRTTPDMAAQLRRVGAAAREVLLDLAAEQSKLERKSLTVTDGQVKGPGGKPAFAFGKLTKGQKLVKLIDERAPTTPPAKWTVAGTSVPKVDGRAFVTGAHRYTSDVKRPGMLFGKVLRPPSFGAKLDGVKTAAAEKQPGVVVAHSGDFVGVAAPTDHAAEQALALIDAQWEEKKGISNDELYKHLKTTRPARGGRGGGGFGGRGRGGRAAR